MVKPTKIAAVAHLVEHIKTLKKPAWFRGHANLDWKLQPTIIRNSGNLAREMEHLKDFQKHSSSLLAAAPQEEWEWLFLMQHHGVRTRLLDWTESPLTALYFATENTAHDHVDGVLWSLNPRTLNGHANIKLESDSELPSFAHNKELEAYLPSRVTNVTTAKNLPVAISNPRWFRRAQAQLGNFVIFHRNETPLEQSVEAAVSKIRIPKAAKRLIRRELNLLGINKLSLFPELENIAERIS